MTLAAAWVRNEWAAVRAAVGRGGTPAGHDDAAEGPPDAALHFNVTGDLVSERQSDICLATNQRGAQARLAVHSPAPCSDR